jgi:hypothetical protein
MQISNDYYKKGIRNNAMTNEPTHPHKVNTHNLDASQIDEIAQLLALAFQKGSGLSQICNAEGEELHHRLRFLFQIVLATPAATNQLVLSIKKDA